MKRIIFLLVAAAALACVIVSRTRASGFAQEEAASVEASPIYGVIIPPGYRDWKLISVTHEEGAFDQLRAQLDNDMRSRPIGEGGFRSQTARSLSRCIGSESPPMRTTKFLVRCRPSLPARR
jgi:hypothetical protein